MGYVGDTGPTSFTHVPAMPIWSEPESKEMFVPAKRASITKPKLMACVRTEDLLSKSAYASDMTEQEQLFGNYEEGRWGFMLTDIKPLPEPIPAKGALGLWEWDESS